MPDLQHARVGDIDIAFEDLGEGERPLVLVHGYTGSRDDFADVHAPLAALGRTIVVDQRGHGASTNVGRPEAYGLGIQVADLLGFLDALAIERCDLLGHSLGGMVAMRFALAHPQRVASLVLMDTSPVPIGLMPVEQMQKTASVGRERGMGVVAEAMRRAEVQRPPAVLRCIEAMGEERYWERIRIKLEAMDPEAMHQLAVELAGHAPVLDRLGGLACPTTVLVGEQDAPFVEPSRRMADAIPGARLCVISEAAHSPQLENQPAWLEAVRGHLREARRQAGGRSA